MGCGRSRDVEAARDAPSEPPPLPDLAPMAELEALLAEAVRLGMLDRRGGAETRQRVVDGELALDAVRNTWREILGFDDAPLTGDEVEVSIRREHPVFEGARPRSGSLVASAHDDLTSASDDDSSDGDVAADGGEELLKNDVRRLSFLRNLTSRGRVQWDGTELSPPEGGWVPYAVLSCGKFGLGVFRPDDAGRPAAGAPRLQVGDAFLGRPPSDDDAPMVAVRVATASGDVEGLVQRFRDEGGRRRVLVAPAATSPDRPRRAPRVPLSSKLGVLKAACQSLAVPWEDGHIQVILRRETAARDALDLAAALPARDFWKTWRFDIADEPGMDAGGLARECWALIAAGVLDPESKYWRFAATDNVTLQIRPPRDPAAFSPEDAKHYRVAGRLVAKALFDGQTIPAHLNRPMLKHLLAMPVTFSDLEYVDALLYRSCRHVADSADAESLCLTFSYRDRDCARAVDLGPGGADRDVDAANKDEYVARLFKFAMLDVVSKPLGKFLKGFYEVLPLAALNAAAFDPGDLELAIAGLDDVDVADWRAHTEYSQGYDDDDPAVANFWSFVAGLPDEKRAKLLQFVTGTSRLPAGGFANLQGRDGVTKGFELRRRPGGDKAFPVAHTCFNRLDLPAYSDVAVLARILSAILEGDVLGFSGD